MARRLIILSLAAVVLGMLAVACGDDGDKPEDAVRDVAKAYNDKDVDQFLAFFTDDGIAASFDGATREEAQQSLGEFIGEPPLTIRKITKIEKSGDNATVDLEAGNGVVLENDRFELVKDGGKWKVDGGEFAMSAPPIPSGAAVVNVRLQDFSFAFNEADITGGNIAFRVENTGRQEHELAIIKANDKVGVDELLNPEGIPDSEFEGDGDIGGSGPWQPGETGNVVFTEPLEPGRYVFMCFVSDEASGKDHSQLGMATEFSVP